MHQFINESIVRPNKRFDYNRRPAISKSKLIEFGCIFVKLWNQQTKNNKNSLNLQSAAAYRITQPYQNTAQNQNIKITQTYDKRKSFDKNSSLCVYPYIIDTFIFVNKHTFHNALNEGVLF